MEYLSVKQTCLCRSGIFKISSIRSEQHERHEQQKANQEVTRQDHKRKEGCKEVEEGREQSFEGMTRMSNAGSLPDLAYPYLMK
ncbi:MAG: hypothetical protein ABIT34_06085 [Gammaproteobacteria bacterium]